MSMQGTGAVTKRRFFEQTPSLCLARRSIAQIRVDHAFEVETGQPGSQTDEGRLAIDN
jgi:hypothetical protein